MIRRVRDPSDLDFYYDFVCPYAYLASLQVEALAGKSGARLTYRPILLGGVFRAIGSPNVPASKFAAAKARYLAVDLERAAAKVGAELHRPSAHPRRTVLALRAALASGDVARASHALFAAYWKHGRDLEDPGEVRSALDRAGLDGAAAVERADKEAIKAELRARTDEAVAAGVFGVPSFVARRSGESALFWGVDRMELVEVALAAPRVLRFYFDYSSPFAYLAATDLAGLVGRTGALLELRPILLGALFKSIGTANVPLFEMPEAKQRHQGLELERWARRRGVPFRFASRFPMNTVKALRLTLVCPEDRRLDLALAIFRALWVYDRDISSESELAGIAASVGLDAAALVSRIADAATKDALRRATADAETKGVFGVPTFEVVEEPEGASGESEKTLYWGQDRVADVERNLKGSNVGYGS